MLMQNEQVSGARPCGHFPVVGSTRISASRCFIVSGLSFGFSAGGAGAGAAAAGFAAAGFFAAGFAAAFVAFFAGAFAFFAAFFFAIYAPPNPWVSTRAPKDTRGRCCKRYIIGRVDFQRCSGPGLRAVARRQPMSSRTRARNFATGIGFGK